ncbi:MAG: histidine ammonia-lyase [Chloroflexi bacterium]|nr:histidine ammonia-lyase [Chloroflexota bacterium]
MTTCTVSLDGQHLTIEQVAGIARSGWRVAISAETKARMQASADAVTEIVRRGGRIYGVTTGFGALQERSVAIESAPDLQRDLVRSHAAGVGPALPEDVVRAMLTVRINSLARGVSGIRPRVVELLAEMVNRGLSPVVPAQGSLGASGDLAQLAHVALSLIGEGTARVHGAAYPAPEAFRRVGLAPMPAFAPKEALALLNGTAAMAGGLALAVADARRLLDLADLAGALSFTALGGLAEAFDPIVQELRPFHGQRTSARRLRQLLLGSTSRAEEVAPASISQWSDRTQDAYSLRCMPQVHGASREALAFVEKTVATELNAVTDNPLVVARDGGHQLLCQGNFHGQPLALAADFLAIALAEIASISERRTAQLVSGKAGLPPFLAVGETSSGYMIAQYTAAALVSENKVLCHPASVDSIPSSGDQEDHVSMGWTAVRKLRPIVENVGRTLAIELCTAAQALDIRETQSWWHLRLGPSLLAARRVIREVTPSTLRDAPLHPLFEAVTELIWSGKLAEVGDSCLTRHLPESELAS